MRTPKDWGQPCPNPACVHYNRMQQGNVSALATYLTQSGKRRIFRCHTCELPFSETRETVFFDLRTSEEKVMMALKMLLVRVDLAGIGFVLGVTEETVLAWLKRGHWWRIRLGARMQGFGRQPRKDCARISSLISICL